jgi:hypothetical protein
MRMREYVKTRVDGILLKNLPRWRTQPRVSDEFGLKTSFDFDV